VFTVIALALVGLNVQLLWHSMAAKPVLAQGKEPIAVFVAEVSHDAAKCLAGSFWFSSGDEGPCIAAW